MAVSWTANLDPKIVALVDIAFDKSWQSVEPIPDSRIVVRGIRAELDRRPDATGSGW